MTSVLTCGHSNELIMLFLFLSCLKLWMLTLSQDSVLNKEATIYANNPCAPKV